MVQPMCLWDLSQAAHPKPASSCCAERGKPSIDTMKKGNIRRRYFVLFFCLKSIWLGKLRNPGQFLGGGKPCLSSVVFVGLLHLQPEGL